MISVDVFLACSLKFTGSFKVKFATPYGGVGEVCDMGHTTTSRSKWSLRFTCIRTMHFGRDAWNADVLLCGISGFARGCRR